MVALIRPATLCALLVLLLSACGTSAPVRYYALSSTVPAGTQQASGEATVLGVGPMRMAEYLNRPQIVTRAAGSEIVVDEFSRWAEPMAKAFHRILAADIDNRMEGVSAMVFPWESALQEEVDYRLLGEVLRFDADASGSVVLETQWGITAAAGESVVRQHRARYEARAASDKPAAVASAMNEALGAFSADVAARFQGVLD